MKSFRTSKWLRRVLAPLVVIPLATVGFGALEAQVTSAGPGPVLTGAPINNGSGGGGMSFKGLPWAVTPTSGCPGSPSGESVVEIPGGSNFTHTAAIKVKIDGKTATMVGTPKTNSSGAFTDVDFDVPCTVPGPATYPVTVTAGSSSATYGTTSTKPTGDFNELSVNNDACDKTLTVPTVSTTTHKSQGHIMESLIFYSGSPQGSTPTFPAPKTGKPYTYYFMDDSALGLKSTPNFPVVYINGKLIRLTTANESILTDDTGTVEPTKKIAYPLEPVTGCGGSPGFLTSTQTFSGGGMEPMPGKSNYDPPTTHMRYLNEASFTFTPGKMKAVTGSTPKFTKAHNTVEVYEPDGDGDAGAYEWTVPGGTPDLVVSKSVSPTSGTNVTAGGTLAYTLTFSNAAGTFTAAVTYVDNLSGVLDDATVVTGPSVTGSGLTAGSVTGGKFTVTGTVPAGKTDTVTYRVKVKTPDTGNHRLTNFLLPSTTKTSTCKSANGCYTTTNPVPAISIKKSATPTTVTKAGTTVTYKFVVTDTGGTPLTNVSVTDQFTAPSTGDSLASAIDCLAEVTPTGPCSGTTTALAAGQSATFTAKYKVTSGDLANGKIDNSATASGTARTPNDPTDRTTITKVVSAPSTATVLTADLATAKVSSPVSRTNVSPGETVTYTLTFSNAKGTAKAPVAYVDDLSDVIDDAAVTVTPHESTGSGLTVGAVSAGRFTISGTVPAKTVDKVSYTVKVDPVLGDKGNHVLNNYLDPTGTPTPSSCKITNPDCTTNPVPAIAIVKSATPTAVTHAGQTVTYTFTVTNTGGTALTDVSVNDAFTSPSTSDSLSAPIDCKSLSTPTGTCSGTSTHLAVGQMATFTVTYSVTSTDLANGVINNSATASGTARTAFDLTLATHVVSTPSVASVKTADLVATKSVTPPSGTAVTPGQTLTYTLTFSNAAGTAKAPVSYTDTLKGVLDDASVTATPQEKTGSGLTVGSISGGQFVVTGTVPARTVDTVTYKVKVEAAPTDTGNHLVTDFLIPTGTTPPTICTMITRQGGSLDCTTNPIPAITIVKSATPTTVTQPGQTVTYTFTVTNTGALTLHTVSVTDGFTSPSTGDSLAGAIDCQSLSTPTGTCTGTSTLLDSGQQATFQATYDVTTTDLAKGVINNSATASGEASTPVTETTVTVISTPSVASVKTADLNVSKSVTPRTGTVVVPGQTLKYTLTFTNSLGTAPAPVNYTDTLKGVLDDASITVTPKETTGSGLTEGAISGEAFTVTGTVPGGTTDTVTYSVTVDTATADTGNHQVTDFLEPTGTTHPLFCGGENPDCTTNPIPAISIVKSATPTVVTAAGQTVTYSFTVTNTGATTLSTVSVTDKFTSPSTSDTLIGDIECQSLSTPTGTCTGTKTGLAPGQTATFTIIYEVTATDLANGVINNSATASGVTPTPLTSEVTVTVTSTPSAASVKAADLVVTKSVTPPSGTLVEPGEVLTYTLTFANTKGTAPAPVDYTDTLAGVLDDGTVTVNPAEATGSGLTVGSVSGGKFTITGTVPGGTTDTVTYKVKVDAAATDTGNHLVTDFLVPGTTPPPTTCETSDTCTTNPVPAITIKKTATPATVTKAGQTVTYTFLVTDTGATTLSTVSVTDAFTSPTTKDALVTSITCVAATTSGTCTTSTSTATLTPGQHATFTVTYDVSSTDLAKGVINNSATASGTTPTPDTTEVTVTVTSAPSTASVKTADLITAKSSSPTSTTVVKPTQTVVYTLTFANTKGTAPAPVSYTDSVSDVTDDATVVTAPAEATGSGLTVGSISGGKFTITGTVPAGTTDTVTYSVKVDAAATDAGNHVLNNYLVSTGTETPSNCTSENPDCTTNPVPAITIKKTATPATVTKAGQTVTYTFLVTDTGATTLSTVSVTDAFTSPTTKDALVTSITCVAATTSGTCTTSTSTATLTPGQHATFTVTYDVSSTDLAKGVINNSATASGTTPTPDTTEVTVTVTSAPSTASVKTADLITAKSSSPTSTTVVKPTQTVVYTLTFANTKGTAPAPVSYTDSVSDVTDDATVVTAPAEATGSGLTVGSISGGKFTITGTVPAGTTDTVTYSVKVDAAATDAGNHVLNNYLVPTGTETPSNCTSENPDCTTNPVPAITIKKTATPATVTKAGQTVTYTFLVTDTGATTLSTVSVTDAFTSPTTKDALSSPIDCATTATPSSTCSGITVDLVPGESATFHATYKVTSTDLAKGVINNSATASGHTPTPLTTEVTVTVTSAPSTASVPTADLIATKSVTPPSGTAVESGEVLTYTLTFANTHGTIAAPVTYTDTLAGVLDDAGLSATPKEASGSGLTVGPVSGGKFTVTGTVAAGAKDSVTYKVTVDAATADTGNHLVTDYLVPTGTAPPSTCKSTNADCTTNPVPTITIKKTVTTTTVTKVGQTVTYTFVVTDTGGTALDSVSVADKFSAPSTKDVLSSPIDCASLKTPAGTCSGTTINLAAGQSADFTATYTVTSTDAAAGVINNSATASGTPPNSTSPVTSAPATASVTVKVPAAAGTTTSAPKLAFTGAPLAREVAGGSLLVLLGSALLLLAYRRRRQSA